MARRQVSTLLLVACAFAGAAGCLTPGMKLTDVSVCSSSGPTIHTFRIGESDKAVQVHVAGNLSSGSLRFELLDPTGASRWSKSVEKAGLFDEKKRFDAMVGEWGLRVTATRFSGNYDASIRPK